MKAAHAVFFLFSAFALTLASCEPAPAASSSQSSAGGSSSSEAAGEKGPEFPEPETYALSGVEDVTAPQGRYFDPYFGVKAASSSGEDVTSELTIEGNVDYGTPGTYELVYDLFGERTARKVTIEEDPAFGRPVEPYIYTAKEPYAISEGRPASGAYKDSSYASYLTDGDLSTRYETPWSDGPFDVVIDLGAVLSFTRIDIYFEAASAKSYELLVSDDGKDYSTILSKSNLAYGTRTDSWDVNSVGRYVMLRLKERNMEAYGYSIYEFEVYGTRGLAVPRDEYPDLFSGDSIADEQSLDVTFPSPTLVDQVSISYSDWVSATSLDLYGLVDGEYVTLGSTNSSQTSFSFAEIALDGLRLAFHSRPLSSKNYRVNLLTLSHAGTSIDLGTSELSASTVDGNHVPSNVRGDYNTFWGSEVSPLYAYGQVFDLGSEKEIGDVDLTWNNNYGKVYDLYFVSSIDDLDTAEPVYRELAGYQRVKTISVYRRGRYLVIKDYSNPNANVFQLTGIDVHSALPSSGTIDYLIGELPVATTVEVGDASYLQDDPDALQTARGIGYAASTLSGKAIDSNSWWNSLLINNYGHANYLNPLRAKFSSDGLMLSAPGTGYFETTWNRSQELPSSYDLTLAPSSFAGSRTTVLDYDDFGVKVSYGDGTYDQMVASLYQGATAVDFAFASKEVSLDSTYALSFYDLAGNPIEGSLEGDSFVVSLEAEAGYEGDVNDGKNPKKYEERLYLVSLPEDSSFDLSKSGVAIGLGEGNFLSVSLLPSLEAASFYHEHAYAFLGRGRTYYEVEGQDVDAQYVYGTQAVRPGFSSKAILAMLPHQWHKSSTPTLGYTYETIRGPMKTYLGNAFMTSDTFPGLVPAYDEPTDSSYSRSNMASLLEQYDERTSGNLLSADAYWQGKALHPLAQAVYESQAIGELELRDSFLTKIKDIIAAWFSYDGEDDEEYFYYDDTWGTLYYASSEFGANYNLADHHFTYGYFAMALAPLFEFDKEARASYEDMARLLVLDYMNYTDDESMFCRFRNYDLFAGHSWAGGYADSDTGNNQESASESLSSYASAYELAMVLGDEEMADAAAFLYTTELGAIKTYWFDYSGDTFPSSYPYQGVGQIYGGSIFYGTFFNGDPTYIYGIQWLPSAEYLSGYAYGEEERAKLEEIYDAYLEEERNWTGHEPEDGYQHILFALIAFFDPDEAIAKYNTRFGEISGNNEVFNVYYMIHALKSMGTKDPSYRGLGTAASAIYTGEDGKTRAVVWNPSDETKSVAFYHDGAYVGEAQVAPHTLKAVAVDEESVARMPLDAFLPFGLEDASKKESAGGTTTYTFDVSLREPGYLHIEAINDGEEDLSLGLSIASINYSSTLTIGADSNDDFYFSRRIIASGYLRLVLTVPDELYILGLYVA